MPSISRFFGIVILMYYDDRDSHYRKSLRWNRLEESMILIRAVKPLDGFKVLLYFSNDEKKVVDLFPLLRGPIFEPIRNDPIYFQTVHVDEESGTICWDNHADIDPNVLYGSYKPAWQEVGNLVSG